MNYSLLDKLTIIIFSYNRHKFLKRTIKYWSNYNIKLVILDGSDSKLDDPYLKNQNIKYIHNTIGLYERLLSSINYIDTEFMILGTDDEFYLPSALCSCIKFLSINNSFSSCGGRAIGFGFDYKRKLFGKEAYSKLKNLSLDQDSATKRIHNHFSNYVPAHFYSVIRFEKWKKICSNVFQKRYNFGAAFELQLEFLVLVAGKSKIISELMWMRNNEKEAVHINSDIIKTEIQDWWFDKNFYNEKIDFLHQMSLACKELSSDTNFKFHEHEISELFQVYINQIFKHKFSKKSFFRNLINFVPLKIKKFKKNLIENYKFKNDKYQKLEDEINLLESEGVKVNHKELNKIISILINMKSK